MFQINTPKRPIAQPTGFSFELPDLLMARAWAEYHDLRMVIELDCGTEGDEYEEVVAFYPPNSGFRRWMMWRGANGIVVQPMMGRTQHFGAVADALEQMLPPRQ